MRNIVISAFVLCTAAHGAVITFEEFANGPQASNFLASYGISSVTEVNGTNLYSAFEVRNDSQVNTESGTKFLAMTGSWWPNTGQHSTTFVFSSPVQSFSFWVAGNDQQVPAMAYAGWKAQAFDALNNLVSTYDANYSSGGSPLTVPVNPVQHTLSGSAQISSIVFSMNYTGYSNIGSVYVDSFEFTPVPEPSSASLAAVALGFVVFRHRRRV